MVISHAGILCDVCKLKSTNAITDFYIVKCFRPEVHYANFSLLELQLTNQVESVEGATYKIGVKELGK